MRNVTFKTLRRSKSIRSMQNYSDEIFLEQLRATKFPDYSNHTCVNYAHQYFATKFLSVISSLAPIRTFRAKSNTKPWFDIDVLNVIQNRYKHYRKFKRSGKQIENDNFDCTKLSLKKVIRRKNFTLKKTLQKIGIMLKNSRKL